MAWQDPYQIQGRYDEPPPEPAREQLAEGYVPSSLVWAYAAIVTTFLCSPLGMVFGIVALTRTPQTPRAKLLATTAIAFGILSILAAAGYILSEMAKAG